MKYQVGNIFHLQDNDPVFTSYEEAAKKAQEMWIAEDVRDPLANHFIGIWRNPDIEAELVAIFHAGELFTA